MHALPWAKAAHWRVLQRDGEARHCCPAGAHARAENFPLIKPFLTSPLIQPRFPLFASHGHEPKADNPPARDSEEDGEFKKPRRRKYACRPHPWVSDSSSRAAHPLRSSNFLGEKLIGAGGSSSSGALGPSYFLAAAGLPKSRRRRTGRGRHAVVMGCNLRAPSDTRRSRRPRHRRNIQTRYPPGLSQLASRRLDTPRLNRDRP